MEELWAILEGERDINPSEFLIPSAHLNPLRRDPFRTNGLKRKGGGVLVPPFERPGRVTSRLMADCKHRVR